MKFQIGDIVEFRLLFGYSMKATVRQTYKQKNGDNWYIVEMFTPSFNPNISLIKESEVKLYCRPEGNP